MGEDFGGGYVFLGHFVASKSVPISVSTSAPNLSALERSEWCIPLLNSLTTPLLNAGFRFQQSVLGPTRQIPLEDAFFPIHRTQFYFKLFGRSGFHEYQVLVAPARTSEYLTGIRDYLRRWPVPVTLASAKSFRGKRELLRFSGDGICLALNFPRLHSAGPFLAFLDELVQRVGGIPNIVKDSRLPRHVAEACYPEIHKFRDGLRAFDPSRVYLSELSERLGL
jgi:decaprenylphospho-beta-D-ribofuranose 2-oxidase